VRSFATGDLRRIELAEEPGGHGGDRRLLIGWLEAARSGDASTILTGARESLRIHVMAFAAEVSRHERRLVELAEITPEPVSAFLGPECSGYWRVIEISTHYEIGKPSRRRTGVLI
jgi:hypothetical protein